ncbi:craniofacial development protein 2-like [Macrobrachium nipponense]|uniref:craniofacial development protein 2-like n=1 Tax=Macrobrachium nipponense TaxID=159736 RepID=UPI0030C827BC
MQLKFGTWNVRTLLDENENRPGRRTAYLYIVALSETRIAGEGQLCEEGGGYTFFWKGQEPGTPRQLGVGFTVKNCMLFSLTEYPSGINERLMTFRLYLEGNKHATVISAYAPTLLAEDQTKELFYAALDTVLTAIPNEDKLMLLGDFSARVGRDSDIWRGTIGKEGVGKINANGTLLLSKCVEHDLVVTNTLFRQKNKVRSHDQKDVLLTRSVTGSEECWTDHHLVYSCIMMKTLTKKRNAHALKRLKFNVDSLKNDSNKLELQLCLANKLEQEYPPNIVDHWSKFKDSVNSACKESVGLKKYKHQDWFDQKDAAIQELIQKARKYLFEHLNDAKSETKKKIHHTAKAQIQNATREMKNKWLT